MKKSKGFSLIELLLVIVVLALLAIIIYPKVLNSYKKAKRNSFLTEAKAVYTTSDKKFAAYQIQNKTLELITDTNKNSLDFTNTKLKYCVTLDKTGITSLKVTNGEYYVEGKSDFISTVTTKQLKYGLFNNFDCDYVLNEKDLLDDFDIEEITDTKKYATAMRWLWISFVVLAILGLMTRSRNKR